VKKISLLGHKDHGKSTLIGSMLMQTGAATKVRIEEAKKYSEKKGKTFEPAFILDSFAEEREREMTYDTTRAQIKYKNNAFEFIDVPGHEELIKNMISGASYGDIALLLVSALPEEGIRDQTKRHVFLAQMLGMNRLIVAVNKMDKIGYNEERFAKIKEDLTHFLKKINFNTNNVKFVPISAYKGENLTTKSRNIRWYAGKCLADLLCEDVKEGRKGEKLRILVQGIIGVGKDSYIAGKVVSGKINSGERVKIFPSGRECEASILMVKNKKAKSAKAGENIAIKASPRIANEAKGSIILPKSEKITPIKEVRSLIFIIRKPETWKTANIYGNKVGCEIKISKVVEASSGDVLPGSSFSPLNAAHSIIKLERPMLIEDYNENKELGRFVLSDSKGFFGIGISEG
jgi:bifunctional enzyme CysN/CysC/sulfate adenylyltransferase subunit 1